MIDPDVVKTRINEFHKRHGEICFNDGNMWYYPDGAYRDIDRLGVLAEPMNNDTEEGEYSNAQNIVKHYELKLKSAVQKFTDYQARLATMIPSNPSEEIAQLRRLQGLVEERKTEVEAAKRKLDATRKGKRRLMFRQAEEDERQRIALFHAERRAIRI